MADLTPQDMAANLLASGFERNGPSVAALSDPIADTPMVVTLDQLRPYDHDPRVTRNPAYEDIKASIRERGLDAPPAITRRPGEPHYIIRNGGNTRLAILRELWSETKDERFFRIPCLFRPWPQRGEVVMLTGHLAENELRGGLSFIERALGVEKAREFYEQEMGRDSGQPLSQSELARRLTADGFPLPQSHISRMQDAVHYLLPAIPTLLYGGLGRHQVERLAVLRKACERTWERHALRRNLSMDFATLFQDLLAQFDTQPDNFSPQRVQDELVGQMAELLEADYDTLSLEIDDSESRQRALTSDPAPLQAARPAVPAGPPRPPSPPSLPPGPSVQSSEPGPGQAAQAATDRMHVLAHRRLRFAHRFGHHRLQVFGAIGVVLGHAIAEHQPVAGLRFGQIHHFQRIFLEIDEADLLPIPGEIARQRLAEIGAAGMRLGNGLHRRHHQPIATGLVGFAQTGIERAAVVANYQRGMAGAQNIRHVHTLCLQLPQATGFGSARRIAAAMRWRAQGIQMETAGNKIEQAQGHGPASFAVLLQPGTLPFDDDGLNHDRSSLNALRPQGGRNDKASHCRN